MLHYRSIVRLCADACELTEVFYEFDMKDDWLQGEVYGG